jgi:hypothetical protein
MDKDKVLMEQNNNPMIRLSKLLTQSNKNRQLMVTITNNTTMTSTINGSNIMAKTQMQQQLTTNSITNKTLSNNLNQLTKLKSQAND